MSRRNRGPYLKWRADRDCYVIQWFERGQRRTYSTGQRDRKAAERTLADFIVQNEQPTGGRRPPASVEIADALTWYMEEHVDSGDVKDPARVAYAVDRLLPFWGNKTLDDVHDGSARMYRARRAADGVGDGTIRREIEVLHAAARHAFSTARTTHPVTCWKPAKPPAKERWLTRDEAARLIRAARKSQQSKSYLPLFILVSLYHAPRKVALLTLQGHKIDLERMRIDFREDGQAETNKRRPRARIYHRLRPILRARLQRIGETGRLISRKNGRPVSDIKKSFRAACEEAGLGPDVTPHTLKHTAITWLVQAGWSYHDVSGFTNVSVKTIESTYGHHAPPEMQSIADARIPAHRLLTAPITAPRPKSGDS